MRTLLEKAKEYKTTRYKKVFSQEEFDLVFAWLNDEITMAQVSIAIKHKRNHANIYTFMARTIKNGVEEGYLVINKATK